MVRVVTKMSLKDEETETWSYDEHGNVIKYNNHKTNFNYEAQYEGTKRTYYKDSNMICRGAKRRK